MSASLRVVATTAPSRASSSSRAAVQMTVGCPATPPVAVSRSRCAKALAAVGMPPRRLASSVAAPRAVRADAPTETLDSATIDAIFREIAWAFVGAVGLDAERGWHQLYAIQRLHVAVALACLLVCAAYLAAGLFKVRPK